MHNTQQKPHKKTYTLPQWTCVAVLDVLRNDPNQSRNDCKNREHRFKTSRGEKPKLRKETTLVNSQREKKNKNRNETANIVGKLAQNCVVSDFSSIKMA